MSNDKFDVQNPKLETHGTVRGIVQLKRSTLGIAGLAFGLLIGGIAYFALSGSDKPKATAAQETPPAAATPPEAKPAPAAPTEEPPKPPEADGAPKNAEVSPPQKTPEELAEEEAAAKRRQRASQAIDSELALAQGGGSEVPTAANATPIPSGGNTGGQRAGSGAMIQPVASAPSGDNSRPDNLGFQEQARAKNSQTESQRIFESEPTLPLTVTAGSMIPAVLVKAINSDLPSSLTAQVRENVYDTVTGNYLLIPAGSRLVGSNNPTLGFGQDRIFTVWNELILPDGRRISLGTTTASDRAGQGGLTGDVNYHFFRTFMAAGLVSLFSAGLQLSQPSTTNSSTNPSNGQIISGAVASGFNQTALQILNRYLSVQPTVTLKNGERFNIDVTQDLVFRSSAKTK